MRVLHPSPPLWGRWRQPEGAFATYPDLHNLTFSVWLSPSATLVASSPQGGRRTFDVVPNHPEKTSPEFRSGLLFLPLSPGANFRRATLTRRPDWVDKIRRPASATRRDLQGRTSSDPDPQTRAASLSRLRRQTGSSASAKPPSHSRPIGGVVSSGFLPRRRPRPLMQCPARYETPHQALLPPEPTVAGPSGDGRGSG